MEDTNITAPRPPRKLITKKLLGVILAVLVAVMLLIGFKVIFDNPKKQADIVTPTPKVVQVLITNKGFEPATVDIAINTVVEWVSTDTTTTHIVAANPYPSHTDLPDLVSPQLGVGAKYRYTFNKKGTYKYHDGLKPTTNGSVVVK